LRWLDSFKRALIESDYESMEKLLADIPEFKDIKEQKEALHLIVEAKKVVKVEKDKTLSQMQKIVKTKNFLTQKNGEYSFDMSF
jgi:enterochelin esterase-like enzyme